MAKYNIARIKPIEPPNFMPLPLVGIIEGFRWCLIPNYPFFSWTSFIPTIIFVCATTIIAIVFFRKRENSFVDYI